MFEDDDQRDDEDGVAMQRLFAGVSLFFLAAICLGIYFYYLLAVGFAGPGN